MLVLEDNMVSARYESLRGASDRGACVCLRQCVSVIACERPMYACIQSLPLCVNNGGVPREPGTSAGKLKEALFCVSKQECIAKGLVLAP